MTLVCRLAAACMLWMTILVCLESRTLSAEIGISRPKTALDSDPDGWLDILPRADLKGWSRETIAPSTTISLKDPWSVDAKSKILNCAGVGVKEMLLYDKSVGDGVFHLEWRFRKIEGDPEYNSGAYVRNQGPSLWHQIQIAHNTEAPFVGDIFGDRPVNGKPERWVVSGTGREWMLPAGEWNTMEIGCNGREITVWINGHESNRWTECDVDRGRIGLQSEYFDVEFRQLLWKGAKP
ncbi:MAG: DUF1080 domain-containing protein [Planctomycetota bacterium]|nr:DUF1080 domain-containing protein [Planctomycetota bacterium]MDA1180435.1 DUF1080 domain-containing protein [Planctomycetota bacterium]